MHYYTRDGKPCHFQPKKKGGGLRPTTVADARKLGLIPSVSTILGVLHKEQLVQKQMEKVILTLAREYLKDDNYIVVRDEAELVADVKEAAFADWGQAADLGSRIHAAIELNMGPTGLVPEPDLAPYVNAAVGAVEKLGLKKTAAEVVLVDPLFQYAGTTDLLGTIDDVPVVIDFKSTKTKPGKPVEGWDSQIMQLAAYWAAAYQEEDMSELATAYNVYISTTEPGRVDILKRTTAELNEAFTAFLNACYLWAYLNKYDPSK